MKVLVTGGSGFIGSHIVDKLRDQDIEVRVYDLSHSPNLLRRNDVEHKSGSILDLQQLSGAMTDVYAVFHLAAVADVSEVFKEPHYAEQINVRGTINVLEAARRSRVKKIIYGGTTWVYSEADEPEVDEDTPLHPPSHLYTATKIAGEYYCKSYSELYDLSTTVVRYGIPYGPRARDAAVIPIFVKKALAGEPLTIAGDGSQYRNFVYVEDLAEGNVKALKSKQLHRTYNLDGSERVTILDIAETIRDILGDVKIEFTAARPGDFSGKTVSSERAKNELDWEATTTFREGVEKYIDWYRSRQIDKKAQAENVSRILGNL